MSPVPIFYILDGLPLCVSKLLFSIEPVEYIWLQIQLLSSTILNKLGIKFSN